MPRSGASAASVSCIRNAARTARSASSSWATGAPNRATISSPTILSRRPPKSTMSATSASKQASTRRFTCSGSLAADSAVKPTRSAMRTVTRRRSSAAAMRRWPHSEQKRAPCGHGHAARRAGHPLTIPAGPMWPDDPDSGCFAFRSTIGVPTIEGSLGERRHGTVAVGWCGEREGARPTGLRARRFR